MAFQTIFNKIITYQNGDPELLFVDLNLKLSMFRQTFCINFKKEKEKSRMVATLSISGVIRPSHCW